MEFGDFLNKGYHIFVDNFFTTMKLARYLYSKCTFITGTLRKNRKGISPDMKEKFDVGIKKYKRKDMLFMLGYRQKKSQKNQVLLLSTDSVAKNEGRSKRRRYSVYVTNKPKVIRDYNDYIRWTLGPPNQPQ